MDNRKTLEYTVLIAIVAAMLIFTWEFTQQDTRLCRSILDGLVRGAAEAEKFIDWEKFVATGFDVGSYYRRIPDQTDRLKYRRLFIQNFATGFKYIKGDFKKFTHWRVLKRDRTKVVVGADYLLYNKTILFTLSKLPRTKLIAIEWKQ